MTDSTQQYEEALYQLKDQIALEVYDQEYWTTSDYQKEVIDSIAWNRTN